MLNQLIFLFRIDDSKYYNTKAFNELKTMQMLIKNIENFDDNYVLNNNENYNNFDNDNFIENNEINLCTLNDNIWSKFVLIKPGFGFYPSFEKFYIKILLLHARYEFVLIKK